ncbi:MAG: glutathione peroxidase, partial [Sphingomonas oligoaromativorans]
MTSIYDFTATGITGEPRSLADYRGRVMLIVNTASKCGFTPQYEGLEALHEDYAAKGLAVLGFPCNQFGAQEPGDDAEIATFCKLTYDVDFPMFARIEVNGDGAHPLYRYL